MRKIIGILSIGLFSCGANYAEQYTVYIDPKFGDKMDEIITAFTDWQRAVGVEFDIRFEYKVCENECRNTITIHPNTINEIREISDKEGSFGYTSRHVYYDYSNIFVGSDIADHEQWRIAGLHEIGHGLGLAHTGPNTIMYPNYGDNAAHEITCADKIQYANIRHMFADCEM